MRSIITHIFRRGAAVTLYLALAVMAADDADELSVALSGAAPDATAPSVAAVGAVAALALRAAGVRSHLAPAPPACAAPPRPDACADATLAALSSKRAHAALLAVRAAAAPSAPRLRDAGLEELGDAAPPWRRACLATHAPARSLLDLTDPALAQIYRLTPDDIQVITE